MKNTRTNEYNDKVKEYLLNAISSEDRELKTDKDKINYFFERFKNEYCYPQNLVRHPNNQDRLKNWIQGLPSCLNIPFTNYDILQLTEKWHDCKLTEKEENKVLANYFNHIAFKLIQLKTKLNK